MSNPQRYIFNDQYLLRRPRAGSHLFALQEETAPPQPLPDERLCTLTFIYGPEDIALRQSYDQVFIDFFSAPPVSEPEEPDWRRCGRWWFHGLHLLPADPVYFELENIGFLAADFSYDTLDHEWFCVGHPERVRNLPFRLLGPIFGTVRNKVQITNEITNWTVEGF